MDYNLRHRRTKAIKGNLPNMILYENKRKKLINVLKWGNNPFKKFVCTCEIREELELVKSRKNLIKTIKKIAEEDNNFILPIIGDVGSGKTHMYWALKNSLYYYNTIYISLEYVYKKFFYNIYSEFIENLELAPLKFIINRLCDEWGALERKFGFFHVADLEKIKNFAFNLLSNKYSEMETEILTDIISGIVVHQLDPYKKIEAEKWLLGELMDAKELSRLNISHDLRKGKDAFMMLRLLIENSKSGTILFIDDFEKIISITEPKDESAEEIYDPSWLYGPEKSPDDIAAEKVFNKIVQLQQIESLRIIITLKSIDSLEEIKKKYQEQNAELLFSIKEPLFLLDFNEEDIFEFYKESMRYFYEDIGISDFINAFQNPYFPLNKRILRNIFENTKGNPREIIKCLIKIFNEIIYSNEKLEIVLENYE